MRNAPLNTRTLFQLNAVLQTRHGLLLEITGSSVLGMQDLFVTNLLSFRNNNMNSHIFITSIICL